MVWDLAFIYVAYECNDNVTIRCTVESNKAKDEADNRCC